MDGHNDVLLSYCVVGNAPLGTFFETNEDRQIDWPRAQTANFAGGFFAVFLVDEITRGTIVGTINPTEVVALPTIPLAEAQQQTMHQMATLLRLIRLGNGRLRLVRTLADLEHCLQSGTLAVILHFEGAEAIDPQLDALPVYYEAGLRSLGLVWSRPNPFGVGVPLRFNQTPDIGSGLTEAGKALVRGCNELGILIDLSHLNEAGFWDVARLSTAPLVATHSNAYGLCPSSRNLTDKQLEAIRESDGMVGLNFMAMFLDENGRSDRHLPLSTLVRHIDYLVERLGISRVGFGADMSLSHAPIPYAIGDVGGYGRLVAALRQAGYDNDALHQITHGNWLRVLRQTWQTQSH